MQKKSLALIFLVIAVAICFSVLQVSAQEKNTILIAGDEEKEGGFLVEITDEAFKKVGYTPKFVFVPWIRALSKTIEGEYDVLLAAYYTDDRARKLAYSKPVGKAEVILLKRKNSNITYNAVADLKPYRIGHIRGSVVSKEFDEAEKTFLNMQYVSDTEKNIGKLLKGRVDLIVEKKQRVAELLSDVFKNEASQLEYVSPPLKINYFHNAFSKKLPNYQKKLGDFNRGLRILHEDGTIDKILKKHGMGADQRTYGIHADPISAGQPGSYSHAVNE